MLQHLRHAIVLVLALAVQLPAAEDAIEQKLNVAQNLLEAEAYPEVITVVDGIVNNSTATPKQKAIAYTFRGDASAAMGKVKDAYADSSSAIKQQENVTDGEELLVRLLTWRARLADSFGEFKVSASCRTRAARLAPENADVANSLAWFMATCPDESFHDGILAVHHATRACTLTKFDSPGELDTLAAAFARAGRYDDAVHYQELAMAHPEFLKQETPEEVKRYAQRLALYKNRKPYTQQFQTE